jgi:hypothetical protein
MVISSNNADPSRLVISSCPAASELCSYDVGAIPSCRFILRTHVTLSVTLGVVRPVAEHRSDVTLMPPNVTLGPNDVTLT